MKTSDMIHLIEARLTAFPERMSGNEVSQIVAEWLGNYTGTEREAVVGAMREYLAFRKSAKLRESQDAIPESRIDMALDIAERLELCELIVDVELLIEDVKADKVLLPVYIPSLSKRLSRLHAVRTKTGRPEDNNHVIKQTG